MSGSLFVPGRSWLHRLPAGSKLAALFAAGVGVFAVERPEILAVAALAAGALVPVAGLGVGPVVRHLRGPLLLLLVLFGAHALLHDWRTGATVVLRFSVLLLLATVVTATTRTGDLLDVVERALSPLRRVGVDPERAAFTLSLAVRLVPVLMAQMDEIREAQRARGRERSLIALTVPLLVRSLRAADDLSEAIEARGGLGGDRPRKSA